MVDTAEGYSGFLEQPLLMLQSDKLKIIMKGHDHNKKKKNDKANHMNVPKSRKIRQRVKFVFRTIKESQKWWRRARNSRSWGRCLIMHSKNIKSKFIDHRHFVEKMRFLCEASQDCTCQSQWNGGHLDTWGEVGGGSFYRHIQCHYNIFKFF